MDPVQEERVIFVPETPVAEQTTSKTWITLRRILMLFFTISLLYSSWYMVRGSPYTITYTDADFELITSGPKLRDPTPAQLEYWKKTPMPQKASLPGTDFVFNELFRHQNPMDCSNKKFLVYTITRNGIGSDLHVMSWALGVAYATGRILAYEPTQAWRWADVDFCLDKMNPDCYLEQLTNCSVPQGEGVIVSKYRGNGDFVPESPTIVKFRQEHSKYDRVFIPPTIEENMRQQNYQVDVSWWRAVTANYIWRPNARFHSLLVDIYTKMFGGPDKFPQRAFGVHVRHGDKFLEMKLHEFRDYMERAEKMKKEHAYLAMSDVIILSTEDNAVMDEAAKWNAEHPDGTQWQFTYLNDKKVNNQHVIQVARWHFVNAFMTAQADAFIITTGSNWCRVINELRKTRGKLNYALGDLEPGEWKRAINTQP